MGRRYGVLDQSPSLELESSLVHHGEPEVYSDLGLSTSARRLSGAENPAKPVPHC